MIASANLLGILQANPSDWLGYNQTDELIDKEKIEKLIKDRNSARKNRDFSTADAIRDELKNLNIDIEDTPDGTIWKIKK